MNTSYPATHTETNKTTGKIDTYMRNTTNQTNPKPPINTDNINTAANNINSSKIVNYSNDRAVRPYIH